MSNQPTLSFGRHPERGAVDRDVVDEILDTQLTCHVAFAVDGWPYAVPTVHARDGDELLVHGSSLSRMLGELGAGVPVCVTVTAVDGIVVARSAFNHSLNYRSAMVFGVATPVVGDAAKTQALRTVVEHVLPGRWDEVRPPTEQELRATAIVSIPLDRATAKVRRGGSVDSPADRKRPVWCGVLPLQRQLETPELVPDDVASLPAPPSVVAALRRWAG